MADREKEYFVRLELEKYECPGISPGACHVELRVDPAQKVNVGDLCYCPRMNQVIRVRNKNLRLQVHKVTSVNFPPELALKRIPDVLMMQPLAS
ncbi:MAG: hypothetical protein HY801_16590 [Candidatus Lindowbacteria bacterium]|nr:hypothetical protein [Candidatus Lindowbacteria bacterium]